MTETQCLITVLILASTVWITRFLPFAAFKNTDKLPKFIVYLGKVLPAAIMGLLVVYCAKDLSFTDLRSLLPVLISVAAVTLIHLLKRNTILSISLGTLLYMILIRLM